VADLSLKLRDGLHKLSLLLKVGIPDQLGVINFNHLQLLGRSELLLHKGLALSSMRLFYFTDLSHEPLLTFLGLFLAL